MRASERARRGSFLVLDGIDGCGKSTQAALLVRALAREGAEPLHLREPGSTALGERLRAILLDRALVLRAGVEALLFAAARRQMLEELVEPALEAGRDVVCERFHPSTFAYQAVAGELDEEEVLALLQRWAGAPAPDLEIVLDLDPALALARRGRPRDRIEDKGEDFHERVAEGFRRYVARSPRALLVDAAPPAESVQRAIRRAIEERLGARVP